MKSYRALFFIFLLFLTGCGVHTYPPEVSMIREKTVFPPPMIKKEVIVLDAGHGGKDAGASSKKDNYEEKSLTLATTHLLKNQLDQMGYQTILTRSEDVFVPLKERAEFANAKKADLFVSIHYNFCPNPEAQGIEIFYYNDKKSSTREKESKKLGSDVLNQVLMIGATHSRGVKHANFAVIRETAMPAVLIETGFLSNPKERERLKDARYTKALVKAIAAGIDAYLKSKETL